MIVNLAEFLVLQSTVKPVLSGHPRGMAKRPLNRGDRSIEVKITVSKGERNFRGL